jgi:asparagine synthetase B (glutamine-hydrolysing)
VKTAPTGSLVNACSVFGTHVSSDFFRTRCSWHPPLLLLPGPLLDESRLLDYLVPEFDRLPAGHAMLVLTHGIEVWRYGNPGILPAVRFTSLEECSEAFLVQLKVAVKCRLRSIGSVGAMLSGGLDSSSIVTLIG